MRFKLLFFLIIFNSLVMAEDIEVVFSESNAPFSFISQSDTVSGLIPDLVDALFKQSGELSSQNYAYPWSRAQHLVETAQKDAFCTYPSSSRREYAYFTDTPLLYLEYDFLIFSRHNPRVSELLEIDEIDDLKNFVFVSHNATAWEDDNIPQEVERLNVSRHEQLFHLVLGRRSGDFFIMNLEEAAYWAKILKYDDSMMYKQVDFIPDSSIPFHFGIRKSYEDSQSIISYLETILKSEDFKIIQNDIMQNYH